MTDTTEAAVRALLIAAAETERKLPGTGTRPMGYFTTWPIAEAALEVPERSKFWEPAYAGFRVNAAAAEVSLMERVTRLVIDFVPHERDRRAVLAWARAKAGGMKFAKWCRSEGITRQLGKSRVDGAVGKLAIAVRNDEALLRHATSDPNFTNEPENGIEFPTLADCDRSEGPAPTAWRADDAKPVAPDLSDPDTAARVVESIEEHNDRMRRGRERWEKRRAREDAA